MKTIVLLLAAILCLVQGAAAQIQLGRDIDSEAAGDFSGLSVSLSADGNRVAIGARLNDENGDNAGHVRVYLGQDALVLGFPSASGKFYRIEESEDLRVWSIREFRVSGTGENIQRFIPMRGPRLFLRVEEE